MILALLLLWGCQCGDSTPPPRPAAHFGGMSGLVAMTVLPDLDAAKLAARQLVDETDEWPDDNGGAARVGGGLGFVQMAEDTYEVTDGLAAAAMGCGQCHQAAKVSAPSPEPWSHHSAGRRLVDDAVWSRTPQSPPADGPLAQVREAWRAVPDATDTDSVDPDRERLAQALSACVKCHQAR